MSDVFTGSSAALESILIAHRGEPTRFPENTLAGFQAALEAGARYIETDVQMSADGVAVLSHDASLLRVTGHDLSVLDNPFDSFADLPATEPERFGTRFRDLRIATLGELVDLVLDWPDVQAFVELKPASVSRHGERFVRAVLEIVKPVHSRCCLVSFELAPLQLATAGNGCPIGWVLPEWSTKVRAAAERAQPDYLFVNRQRLLDDSEPLWPGGWRWIVYTVNDLREIDQFIGRGFDLIETNAISSLLHRTGSR